MLILFKEKQRLMTDEALVRGTHKGDDRLYAELMRRYMRAVFHLACQFVDPHEAETVAEETFYTFWKQMNHLSGKERFRRQLFTVARVVIRDHLIRTRSLKAGYAIFAVPLYIGERKMIRIPSLLEFSSFIMPIIVATRNSLIDNLQRLRSRLEPRSSLVYIPRI